MLPNKDNLVWLTDWLALVSGVFTQSGGLFDGAIVLWLRAEKEEENRKASEERE